MDIHGKNIAAAGNIVNIGTQINNNNFDDKPLLPNTIPSVPNFVGREDYLNVLRESYKNGPNCFVIHGIGGVGKSALAKKFAGEIKDDFEAKVFVSMFGMSENPRTFHDALLEIVRQFNPQIKADFSLEELKTIFTQYVQNQKTLIILDNARSEIEVAPLITCAEACYIITSRREITTTSGEIIRLKAMDPEDAETLLTSIVSLDKLEGRANELAKLVGFLPMALKPLAKLLKKRFKTISGILQDYGDKRKILEMADTDNDNLSVEASLLLSYDNLSDELKEFWRRLSVFPSDFESQAASMVFGTEFDEGWDVLEKLHEDSLIEESTKSSTEKPRFYLHDLARTFVAGKLSDSERFGSQLRFASYYALILYRADDLMITNNINGFEAGLNLIDTEWESIIAGQQLATECAKTDNDFAELCIDYSGLARDLIILRLSPHQNIQWLDTGLRAAQKLGKRVEEFHRLGNLGIANDKEGKHNEAIEYYQQQLNFYNKGGFNDEEKNLMSLGNIYNNQGVSYNNLELYPEAQKSFTEGLKIARQTSNQDIEARCLGNLGLTHYKLKNYWVAVRYIETSLKITGFNNPVLIAQYFGNLGNCYPHLGEYKKGINYIKDSIELFRQVGDRFGIGNSLYDLGITYLEFGRDKENACQSWKEALEIFEALDLPKKNKIRQLINKNC